MNSQFTDIIQLIKKSRSNALRAVNAELIQLYWNIGEYISKKIDQTEWGDSVVVELSLFIRKSEPDIKGFSDKNLWRMKQFYEAYKDSPKLSTQLREISWSHNLAIFSRCKNLDERAFYIKIVREEKYSFRELELGKDFLFIGEQYKLQVGKSDFFIDLLFFHRGLQCLVAFELKADRFKPAHLGQLNFYLEAIDRDVKKPNENPSIGVLLCKDKDNEVVEYSLSRSMSPTLVAEYKTQLPDKKVLQQKLHELFIDQSNEKS